MDDGSTQKKVTIYTDGACIGNPGSGGYAAILIYGDRRREIVGGFRLTTNNRMELMAAIEGLSALRYACDVTVFTDSRYLCDGINKGWAKSWRSRGWRKKDNAPALNSDLWKRLLDLCEYHQVKLEWVKGHAGVAENERCDQLSTEFAKRADLPRDEAYDKSARGAD